MFKNMNTGTKLALSFGVIVSLLVLISLITTLRIQAINQDIAEVIDDRAVKVELANQLDQATNVQARFLRNALLGHKDPEFKRMSLERAYSDQSRNLFRYKPASHSTSVPPPIPIRLRHSS